MASHPATVSANKVQKLGEKLAPGRRSEVHTDDEYFRHEVDVVNPHRENRVNLQKSRR